MKVTPHLRKAVRPDKAVSYFTNSGSTNWEPALLWLVLAVVAIVTIRRGALPNGAESVTWIGLAALVIAAGAFVPKAVAAILGALLIAGALNVYAPLTGVVTRATAAVSGLAIPKAA
ncbi:MAG: hypothetical protein ABSD62_14740 [Candidatus Limnocylindrales bacterium]|jgi:prepilin signal peptidase PulO-like enzyme (type II secretory pathway)